MTRDDEACARLDAMLERVDRAPVASARDASAVLTASEIAWAASHLESCAPCSLAADPMAQTLLDALRSLDDEAGLPDEAFFAAQREAVLHRIRAAEADDAAGARSVRERSTPSRPHAAARPPRRPLWRPAIAALAAGILLVLAASLVREQPAPPRDGSEPATQLARDTGPGTDDPVADDAWLLAGDDPLGAEIADARDPLRELTDDELDEIEGVFVSVPGWS